MNTIGGIRILEPKMEALADWFQSIEESIRGTDACLQSYVDEQENLQDRVDVLAENLEKVRQDNLKLEEIADLKAQKIDLVNHLHTTIKRINDIRQWIRDNFPESVNDRYYEELDFASISDNE